MNTRWFFGPALMCLSVFGLSCTEIAPCAIGFDGIAPYAVQLTPKANQTFDASCPDALKAPWVDFWNLERFNDTRSPVGPARVSIRPAAFAATSSEGALTSSVATRSGDDDLCSVPSLAPATEGTVTYAASNLVFLEGAQFQGGAMSGSLAYTDGTCTVQYDVLGTWPGGLPCVTSADCNAEHNANPDLAYTCLVDATFPGGICLLTGPFPSKK